jgi:allophanate hydrolase subunit 2
MTLYPDMRGNFVIEGVDGIADTVNLGGAKGRRLQTGDVLARVEAQLHQAHTVALGQRIVEFDNFTDIATAQ